MAEVGVPVRETKEEPVAMIAVCGLDCTSCPSYLQRNTTDQAVLETIAAAWSAQMHREVKPEDVPCSGCQDASEARLTTCCSTCVIRACAHGKGYVTCAECGDYDTCTILKEFHASSPEARQVLDGLRKG